MKICGIDPGVRGGFALIEIVDSVAPQLITVCDIQVSGTGAKERVDVLAIRTWLLGHRHSTPSSNARKRCPSRAHRAASSTLAPSVPSRRCSPAARSRSPSSNRLPGRSFINSVAGRKKQVVSVR